MWFVWTCKLSFICFNCEYIPVNYGGIYRVYYHVFDYMRNNNELVIRFKLDWILTLSLFSQLSLRKNKKQTDLFVEFKLINSHTLKLLDWSTKWGCAADYYKTELLQLYKLVIISYVNNLRTEEVIRYNKDWPGKSLNGGFIARN